MMGLACLFMVACNNAPKQQEQPAEPEQEVVAEEHHCPFCPLKAEYANWDNMDETAKAELNKKAYDLFVQMDTEMEAKKAECEAKCECEHKCQHDMAEMTEGKAREASEAKARRNALHILVLLAKIWRAAFDESLCELLQPFYNTQA